MSPFLGSAVLSGHLTLGNVGFVAYGYVLATCMWPKHSFMVKLLSNALNWHVTAFFFCRKTESIEHDLLLSEIERECKIAYFTLCVIHTVYTP